MNLKTLFETIADKTGAIVNIEIIEPGLYHISDLKLGAKHYYHHGSYCHFAKLNGNQPLCAKNKERSKKIALYGRRFSGTCPFGVWDLAQPVVHQKKLLSVIYLGGFSEMEKLSKINDIEYPGSTLPVLTGNKKKELAHYARFLHDYIQLSYQNWLNQGNSHKKHESAEYYRTVITRFIETRYSSPIQLTNLAENLSMNSNYLGELIKKLFQKNFTQLLTEYRVDQAKVHLRSEPNKSISNIAYECGFNDSNYFSTVFKKVTEISPRKYRYIKDI